jgi:hypothetical protein
MLKKILFTLSFLLMCFSVPSYAYTIGANLVIVNNTNVAMNLQVSHPNGQGNTSYPIPANETTTVYMENGDKTIWLYQSSIATFSLNDQVTQTEYVNGRVAYYVGASLWTLYSFLDSVSSGPGITVDQTFSCAAANTFENRLVINGTPSDAAPMNPNPNVIHCAGLKNSQLINNPQGQTYQITCSDNTKASFLKQPGDCVLVVYHNSSWYSNGCYWTKTESDGTPDALVSPGLDSALVQAQLNSLLGQTYCKDFKEYL